MVLFAIALLVPRPGWTHEQFFGIEEIVVRTYDPQHMIDERIVAARQTADAILRHGGVSLRWWHCDLPNSGQDFEGPCHAAIRANELVVRIVRASSSAGKSALGFSLIDHDTHRSWLATIFADRVVATAERLRLDANILMGRAIAHELGHLLLNSSAHATSGFMQAVWSDAMLTRNVTSDWHFGGSHSSVARRNAVARALLAMPSAIGGEPQ